MRASLVAVIAVVCALIGGAGALVVGKAAGWIDGDGETVILREADAATPASQVEQGATGDESKPLPGNDFDPTEIYAERAAGVVTVQSIFEGREDAESGVAQGSGFVVSDDGYILTNSHVITTAGEAAGNADADAASQVYVEFKDGDRLAARIVGWDVYDDVGLLKVEPGDHTLRPLPLGDSSEVEVGEPVVAIGSPFGQTSTMTAGIVGATERSIESLTSEYSLVDAIQTDAPINRGNSGGPLFDARGLVIGINAQIRSESGTAEGVGFAVPINSAVRTMEQLKETGDVRYAWVGITTQSVTPTLDRRFDFGAERGAAVQSIVPGSPADASDLEAGEREVEFGGVPIRPGGDVIVAIDDEPVENAEDVVRAVTQRLPGETARFTVVRGGERVVVRIKLGERPATPPDDR